MKVPWCVLRITYHFVKIEVGLVVCSISHLSVFSGGLE